LSDAIQKFTTPFFFTKPICTLASLGLPPEMSRRSGTDVDRRRKYVKDIRSWQQEV